MAFIFLHIPKTAGTFVDSVVSSSTVKSFHNVGTRKDQISNLNSERGSMYIGGHMNINILLECVDNLSSHTLVSLVRHPFDRFISAVNYLIEILDRGIDFYQVHPLGARMKILRTYFSIESGSCQNLTHLFNHESSDYMSKFLIPRERLNQMQKSDVSESISILSECLSRYNFLMSVENGGAEYLLDYTCKHFEINQSVLPKPNRNSSKNYVDLNHLIQSGFIEYNRQHSRIDSLLYLMVHDPASVDTLSLLTWYEISLKTEELFFRNSSYISKLCSKLSDNATDCVKNILLADKP